MELGSVILLVSQLQQRLCNLIWSLGSFSLSPLGDKSLLKPQYRETISHIEISQDTEKTHILIEEFFQF